jgi:FixJ family two-component response regulator
LDVFGLAGLSDEGPYGKSSSMGELRQVHALKRVAVIDDDLEMRTLISDVLKRYGYAVDVHASALRILESPDENYTSKLDVIICDVIMPDLDGREFVKKFKFENPSIPVILITGFGSALSPREAQVAGASRLIMKPFAISELLEAISAVTN